MSDTVSSPVTTRQFLARREASMRNERSQWTSLWQECSDYIAPRAGSIVADPSTSMQVRRGSKVGHKILDSTGTWAWRTLTNGMMGGMTSPARPWFVLGLDDPDLSQWGPVRGWLDIVRQRMMTLLSKSNIYRVMQQMYGELAAFGTAVMLVQEDKDDVFRGYISPVGEYMLANSSRMEIDTCYRTYAQTVGQVVQQFGYENCSKGVQNQYDNGNLGNQINVVHAIEPHPQFTHNFRSDAPWAKGFASDYPFRSVYYEAASPSGNRMDNEADSLLSVSGYHEQPFMAPRWDVYGNDAYGRSPAMDVLADVKQLQGMVKFRSIGVHKQVDMPMIADESMRNAQINLLPGGVSYVPAPTSRFEAAYNVALNLNDLHNIMQETRQSIRQGFYADMMMINDINSTQPVTAEEIKVRQQEKMLQLGSVVERNQDELLNPLIHRCFQIMQRRGLVPPPPPEVAGHPMDVEYVSVLAAAQRATSTTSIERLVAFVGNLAAVKPGVLAKLDEYEIVDTMADALLVPSKVLVDTDAAKQQVQAQEQQHQMMVQGQGAMAAVQGAKTLSETEVGGGQNALQSILGGMQPANQIPA
jgi:hypothetical protein